MALQEKTEDHETHQDSSCGKREIANVGIYPIPSKYRPSIADTDTDTSMDTFNLNFSLCMFEVNFLISPPKTTEDRRYKVFILSLYYQFYTKPSVGIDTIDIWIDLPISAVNHKYVYSFHGTRSAVGGQLVTLASMAITLLF